MSEIAHVFGMAAAIFCGSAMVSFGLYAGVIAASHAFGPLRITLGQINIVAHK